MSVSILTFYTTDLADYQRVADLTIPNRDEYCLHHGYTHVVCKGPYRDANLYYAIQRLHKLHDILFVDPNPPEFVWVLNVQSVITNLTIPITSITDDSHDFWISRDCNAVNAGSFIIRKCEWSKQWLEMLIRESPVVNHCWHENQVIIQRCPESPWKERIKVFDNQRVMNSYEYSRCYNMTHHGQWQIGDLALSLPGTTLDKRLEVIKDTIPRVIR